MSSRSFLRAGLLAGLLVLLIGGLGFAGWLFHLPGDVEARPLAPDADAARALDAEGQMLRAALKPPKRSRPLIAVLALNEGTEITDFLTPTGVLRRADVADVITVATGPGPVHLYPALTVEADITIAAFDARHPDGADYVIVPAMIEDDDPLALGWLQAQASRGATIIAVCAGAKVVGAAGLLDGRRATTHWYYRKALLARSPTITWVADRRFVIDHGIVTTTGITASMPMMVTLVDAIAGKARAAALAEDLGLVRWDASHHSAAFRLTQRFATTILGNRLAFWRHERLDLALHDGVDEVSLALVLDAWSRTYRSTVAAVAARSGPIRTRHGVTVLPDATSGQGVAVTGVAGALTRRPARALDQTLRDIAGRYGEPTARVVAMQLEYPWDGEGTQSTPGEARLVEVGDAGRAVAQQHFAELVDQGRRRCRDPGPGHRHPQHRLAAGFVRRIEQGGVIAQPLDQRDPMDG